MDWTRFLLFAILFEAYKCKKVMTNESVNDYLYDSRSRLNNWNKLLPKLKEILPKKYNRSWSHLDSPFWLRMANQAQYLQYLHKKNEKKSYIKFQLAKRIPFIKKLVNQCLVDPWSNIDSCKFDLLNKKIHFLCLIENTESFKIENLFNMINSNSSEVYSKFCWIIYAINYLEQCQINMLLDEDHCGLNNIEMIIKLIIKKFKTTQFSQFHEPLNSFYFKTFKNRAMQILTQILIFLNNIKNEIFGVYRNMVIIDSEKFYELKFNLEKLLNHLLNEYAHDKLKYDIKFKIMNQHERFKMISEIIDLKILRLVNFSIRMILNNLFKQIKSLRNEF